MLNLVEQVVEIVDIMDVLVLEDSIELFSLSIRRVLIRGYRYRTGINRSGPYFEIHTSLHGRGCQLHGHHSLPVDVTSIAGVMHVPMLESLLVMGVVLLNLLH